MEVLAAQWENERPLAVPIQINIQDETVDKDLFIYRELSWLPIPLMTRRLVKALRDVGGDNLQTFETKLTTFRGRIPREKITPWL